MSWHDSVRPASFRGVSFRVDATARGGGRRGQNYEFPKRDTPSDEDLGRRSRRFSISGYVIGPDHNAQADRLQAALETKGPGQLVTHLMGSMRVRCETYTRNERRQEGGMTFFDMSFSEAGQSMVRRLVEATQGQVAQAAQAADNVVAGATGVSVSSVATLPTPKIPEIVSI